VKPETSLAVAKRVTSKDVREISGLTTKDIGRWVVTGSGGVIRCESYLQASRLASALNRCPA